MNFAKITLWFIVFFFKYCRFQGIWYKKDILVWIITKVNENYVILIGSYETSRSRTHVLLINIANGSTIQFFDLLEHRQKHVCTTFEHEGRDLVIVVGGYGWPPSSNSSEIADVFNNDKWSKGLSRNRSWGAVGARARTPKFQRTILLGTLHTIEVQIMQFLGAVY